MTGLQEVVFDAECVWRPQSRLLSLRDRRKRETAAVKVFIDLGPDPQLAVHDHAETMSQLLLDYQTTFHLKDRIWEIIQAKQPTTVKAGRLLSLDLDQVFLGPILELLLADSRS